MSNHPSSHDNHDGSRHNDSEEHDDKEGHGESGSEHLDDKEKGADEIEAKFDTFREDIVGYIKIWRDPKQLAQVLKGLSEGEQASFGWLSDAARWGKTQWSAQMGRLKSATNKATKTVLGKQVISDKSAARFVGTMMLMEDSVDETQPLNPDIDRIAKVLMQEHVIAITRANGREVEVRHTLLDILTNPTIEIRSSVRNIEPRISTKEELGSLLIHQVLRPLEGEVSRVARVALRDHGGLKDLALPPAEILDMPAPNARIAAAFALINGAVSGVTTTVQLKGVIDWLVANPGTGAKQGWSMATALAMGFIFGNEAYHARQQVVVEATDKFEEGDYREDKGDSRMTRVRKGLAGIRTRGEQPLFGSPVVVKIMRKLGMERLNPTVSGEAKAATIAGVSIASLLLTAVSLISTVNTYYGSGKRAKELRAESGEYVGKYGESLRGERGVRGKVHSKTASITKEEDEIGTVGTGADGRPVRVSGSGQGPLFRAKSEEGQKLNEAVEKLTLRTQGRIQGEYDQAARRLAAETSVLSSVRDSEAAIEGRMDAIMGAFVRRVNVEIMGEFERELQSLIDGYVVAVNAAEAKHYPEGNKKRTDRFTIDVERKVKAPDSGKLFGLPTTPFWETVGKSFELFGPWAFALMLACVYLGYLGEGGLEMEMIPNHRKRLRVWLARKFNRPEWAMDDPDAPVKLGEGLSHEHQVIMGKTQDFTASMQRWVNALADQTTQRLDNSVQWGDLNGIQQQELAGIIAGILDRASQYPSLFDQMLATWVHGEVAQSAMVMGKEVRKMQADPDKLVRMLEAGSALDCILSILSEGAKDQSVYTSEAIQIAIGIGRRKDLAVGEKEKLFDKVVANCRQPDVLKGMARDYVTASEGEVIAAVPGGLLTRDPDGLFRVNVGRPQIIEAEKRFPRKESHKSHKNQASEEGGRKATGDEGDADEQDPSPHEEEIPTPTSEPRDKERSRRHAASVAEANRVYYQLMEAGEDELDDTALRAAYERLVRGPLNREANGQTQQAFLDELVASNEPRWGNAEAAWAMLNELMDEIEKSPPTPAPKQPHQPEEPVIYRGDKEEKRREKEEEKLKEITNKPLRPNRRPIAAKIPKPQEDAAPEPGQDKPHSGFAEWMDKPLFSGKLKNKVNNWLNSTAIKGKKRDE